METRTKIDGDDTYDKALQRIMHTVLPPILMTIADKRPADPIQCLADWLYEYREKEDNECTSSSPSPENHVLNTDTTEITGQLNGLVIKETGNADGSIPSHRQCSGQDDIDFTYHFTNNRIHSDVVRTFKTIGDLFDENDIT